MMPNENEYVMCVDNSGYEDDLTLFKVYRVLPAPKDKAHGFIRVVDNTHEDYLFAASRFVPVNLPAESEQAFTDLMARLDQAWADYLAALGPEELGPEEEEVDGSDPAPYRSNGPQPAPGRQSEAQEKRK